MNIFKLIHNFFDIGICPMHIRTWYMRLIKVIFCIPYTLFLMIVVLPFAMVVVAPIYYVITGKRFEPLW